MQKKNKQKVKRPLKNKIILAVVAMCLMVDIFCIVFNYAKFVSLNSDYAKEIAETIINTCTLVIDGDQVEEYLRTRKRDTEYYVTWNKLIDYRNTNKNIMKLSVVNFQNEGGYYVYDTDLGQDGAFLGDFQPYDARQEAVKEDLVNYTMKHSLVYANHTDIYIPIKSLYNIPVAYVVAGIATDNIQAEQMNYLLRLVFSVTGITIVSGVILILFMYKSMIIPINTMAAAAGNYAKSMEDEEKTLPLEQVHIKTGDELERLCESLKKMENDILVSSARLLNATWNSNHDSMTQLYNKRYYHELLSEIQEEEDLGIIYLDIDNLKRMNDTYGHDEGDEVILRAANIIHQYEEPGFECCRVGGDEFVMVLRETTAQTVADLVKQMRTDQHNTLSDIPKDFICRLAVGGAFRRGKETVADVIKRAEEAMYQNKHARR